MNKPRIAHLTYDMRIGGTEQVIKNLIEGMQDGRYEHRILCIEKPIGPFGEMLQQQGITIDAFQRSEGFDIELILRIRHYLKKNHIHILHCHQYTPWVYGCLAAAFTNTKVIFTEHGRFYPDVSSPKRKLVNPILAALTNRITAISKATAKALTEYEFIPAKRIEVIYNGIAELQTDKEEVNNIRTQLGLTKDCLVFGTVARLDPIKNHRMMVAAFAQMHKQQPNSHLLIVGDGEERQNLEQQIKSLELENSVTLTGYIDKPANYLAMFDVFLLPSFSEGTSMTLLEAMSLGKPTIATAVGGTPEIIEDEISGILIPNNNTNSLIKALNRISENIELRYQTGNNSLTRFKLSFTITQMVKKYRQIYTNLT